MLRLDLALRLGSSSLRGAGPAAPVNLVTNGTFDTDTVWLKGVGWTISGGTANMLATGSASNLSQDVVMIAGVSYDITFTVSNYTSGTILARIVGTTNVDSVTRNANGTYTASLVAPAAPTTLLLRASSAGTMSIDNVIMVPT